MLTIVDSNDQRAVRNKDNVLAFYDLMLNQQKPQEACVKYLDPGYIQHNPIIPTGAAGLGNFFDGQQGLLGDYLKDLLSARIAARVSARS